MNIAGVVFLSNNVLLSTLYFSFALNILFFILFVLFLTKTYACEELISNLKKKVFLYVDLGYKRKGVLATHTSDDLLKTKSDGFFRISYNSLKVNDKGFVVGFALASSDVVPSPEVGVLGLKMKDENIPSVENQIFKKNDQEFFNYKGVVVSFDNVKQFFNNLTPNALESLIQREIMREVYYKNKINLKALLIILLVVAVVFVVVLVIMKLQPQKAAAAATSFFAGNKTLTI